MRRAAFAPPASTPEEALSQVWSMMREGLGLRLLQGKLPSGSTLEDARRMRECILQRGRQPSRLLDKALGLERA
jgi:hypothetical protein